MHVISPVLVLAVGSAVASFVTPTARLCGSPTAIPAVLHGEGGGGGRGGRGREDGGRCIVVTSSNFSP